MSPRRRCAFALLGALMVTALGPRAVHAQDAQRVSSRALLLDRALEARNGGDHTYALELAERAAAIQLTPSVGLFIAQEQYAIGRYAAARASARRCARDAQAPNVTRGAEIQLECGRIVSAAATRVGFVRLRPSAQIASASPQVQVGSGASQALVSEGVELELDPGRVRLRVTAEGFEPFEREVLVRGGERTELEIELLPLVVAPVASITTARPVAPRAPRVAAREYVSPRAFLAGPTAILVGGGALGVGALAMLVLRELAIDGLATRCNTTRSSVWHCENTSDARAAWESVQWFNGLTIGLTVVSGLMIAGGATWLGIGLATRRADRVSLVPMVHGVGVVGAF